MTPNKDGTISAFKKIGTFIFGVPGPTGTNSPAVGYGVTPAKNFPGYVDGAAGSGLTNFSFDTPRRQSNSNGALSSNGASKSNGASNSGGSQGITATSGGNASEQKIVHQGEIPKDWTKEEMTRQGRSALPPPPDVLPKYAIIWPELPPLPPQGLPTVAAAIRQPAVRAHPPLRRTGGHAPLRRT